MKKLNTFLKNKIRKQREKKIERIENRLDKGKTKFILLYGILLWTPLWLLFWFVFFDIKIMNVFINKDTNTLQYVFSSPWLYLLRLPVATFLGYINAVSHWHYLHRRLRILKYKILKKDYEEEDIHISR